jgi:hypothetical protein
MTAHCRKANTERPAREGRQDEVAQLAWGVLVAAQEDGVTDLNVIAHAIARNVLRRLSRGAHTDGTGTEGEGDRG